MVSPDYSLLSGIQLPTLMLEHIALQISDELCTYLASVFDTFFNTGLTLKETKI